jgi:DNA-binding helix-hairpin-helix protein with protein kinase domain
MPKIFGLDKLRNIYVFDNRKGKPWTYYVAIAKNLAAAIHNAHEINQVIGDLIPYNILVVTQSGVTFHKEYFLRRLQS